MGRILSNSFQLSGTLFFSLKVIGMLFTTFLFFYYLYSTNHTSNLRAELAHFRHVPMTEEKSRATLEVALELNREYGFEIYKVLRTGPESMARKLADSSAGEEIAALVERKGFFGIGDWVRHWYSLIYAINYYSDDHKQDYKELLWRVNYYDMPERQKDQIRSMVRLLVPPQRNVKVVERLLVDEKLREPVLRMMRLFTEFREARERLWLIMQEQRRLYGR